MHTNENLKSIVIAGRTNVGKSTLFNRLVGTPRALATPLAGTTRDANESLLRTTRGMARLSDTAGFIERPNEVLQHKSLEVMRSVINSADLVLMVFDGTVPPTSEDRSLWNSIRKTGKPIISVINKMDPSRDMTSAYEYYALGVSDPVFLSALHGTNLHELTDRILAAGVLTNPDQESALRPFRFGIVGKPNTGKTSLANRLVPGSLQAIVDETRGTTRDFLYRTVMLKETPAVLVDTPGITAGRKKANLIDHLMFARTRTLLSHIDCCIFVVDAGLPFTKTDQAIADLITKSSCGCIIAVNKWDAVTDRAELERAWARTFASKLKFLTWAPYLMISAQTGLRVEKLITLMAEVARRYTLPLDAKELKDAWATYRESETVTIHKKPLKFYTIKQVQNFPATFELRVSDPRSVHFSVSRNIQNWLRHTFELTAVPITLRYTR